MSADCTDCTVSLDCPACIYDEIYQEIGKAIARLDAWLQDPANAIQSNRDAIVLKRRLEQSQALIAEGFLG